MTVMDIAPPKSEVTWPIPPEGGYSADDLDTIPDLPPHTELIDGSLVFVSPQVNFRRRALRFLESELTRQAPSGCETVREMTITLGKKQRLEPDIMIINAEAEEGESQSTYKPGDVLLVAEVVSAESRVRDRERKPQLYAEAGIRVFWRVESVEAEPVVYAYELDPATRQYVPTGIHHDRLTADWPFAVDLDLTRIKRPGK